jgi:hypothetical protein
LGAKSTDKIKKMDVQFITVLMGKEYADLYLNTVLPTQLSPGNLPSIKDYPDSISKIYTTGEDYREIRKSQFL